VCIYIYIYVYIYIYILYIYIYIYIYIYTFTYTPDPAQVDLLPLKNVGDNLYRLPGRKPAAVRADIAKLGRLDSEYVRESDSFRVDERQLQPLVPRPPPRESVTAQGLAEYAALKAEILRESAIGEQALACLSNK